MKLMKARGKNTTKELMKERYTNPCRVQKISPQSIIAMQMKNLACRSVIGLLL